MSDGEQPDEPMRRPRGRHAVQKGGAVSAGGWRTRLAAAAAPFAAWAEPRVSAAGAWLLERRLHVLIVSATVATVAMLGGAMALISFAGAPRPDGEAATVIDAPHPRSTDRPAPNTYAPILPSPRPSPTIAPDTPTPSPDDEPEVPATDAPTESPAEPEPTPTEEPRRDTAPGATNRPDKPKG